MENEEEIENSGIEEKDEESGNEEYSPGRYDDNSKDTVTIVDINAYLLTREEYHSSADIKKAEF